MSPFTPVKKFEVWTNPNFISFINIYPLKPSPVQVPSLKSSVKKLPDSVAPTNVTKDF